VHKHKKWHETLGELCSKAFALLGSRNLFSSMQNTMLTRSNGRIALNKDVHDALDNFWWMHTNISTRPTQIAEVVPLPPVAEGLHDALGTGTGGIWFPGPLLMARGGYNSSTPVVLQLKWPKHIVLHLVTDTNPSGSITNLDLELAGSLLHLNAVTNCFDVCKQTVLSKGNNLSTTF
jgi:hypothetical protein